VNSRFECGIRCIPRPEKARLFLNKHSDDNIETFSDGRPSLPFPPEEVRCVQLHAEGGGRVVFVARHRREPTCTGWVVHQGPKEPYDQGLLDLLSGIACDLDPAP
jgi:hypothetical protein